MMEKELHSLDKKNLEELLTKRLADLQKLLEEKDVENIKKCNEDIAELQHLIRSRS